MIFSEPSTRGILLAYSSMSGTVGMFFVFALNTFMPWRTAGLVCMFIPILTVLALCFVSLTKTKQNKKLKKFLLISTKGINP